MLALLLSCTLSIGIASARAYPRLGYSIFETRQSSDNVSFGTPSVTAANPFDHTWIESFTALGDSYSVGLGAGHAISAAKGVSAKTIVHEVITLTVHSSSSTPIQVVISIHMAIRIC